MPSASRRLVRQTPTGTSWRKQDAEGVRKGLPVRQSRQNLAEQRRQRCNVSLVSSQIFLTQDLAVTSTLRVLMRVVCFLVATEQPCLMSDRAGGFLLLHVGVNKIRVGNASLMVEAPLFVPSPALAANAIAHASRGRPLAGGTRGTPAPAETSPRVRCVARRRHLWPQRRSRLHWRGRSRHAPSYPPQS